MLILQGILRAATTLGGGTNKKTGELIPARDVLRSKPWTGAVWSRWTPSPCLTLRHLLKRSAKGERSCSCMGYRPAGQFRL